MKIRRRLVKEEAELIKQWPADAILKWTDHNLMCEFCGIFCSDLSNLRRHKKLHFEESLACPKCPYCLKNFFRADNLVRHIKDYCPVRSRKRQKNPPALAKQLQPMKFYKIMATTSKYWTPPRWALVPLDLPIDVSRPCKRGRTPSKITKNIPLQNEEQLADPRGPAPTPITDDDARMLEEYLESETKQEAAITGVSPQGEILIDLTERHASQNKSTDETLIDLTKSPVLPELTSMKIQYELSQTEDDWVRNLLKASDPWASKPACTKEERKIPLITTQRRTTPPWETPVNTEQVMSNITVPRAVSPLPSEDTSNVEKTPPRPPGRFFGSLKTARASWTSVPQICNLFGNRWCTHQPFWT